MAKCIKIRYVINVALAYILMSYSQDVVGAVFYNALLVDKNYFFYEMSLYETLYYFIFYGVAGFLVRLWIKDKIFYVLVLFSILEMIKKYVLADYVMTEFDWTVFISILLPYIGIALGLFFGAYLKEIKQVIIARSQLKR